MSTAGEPAFPTNEYGYDENENKWTGNLYPGLTKREYFAAMAMQGICANSGVDASNTIEWTAKEAVQFADALLAALERRPE